MDQKVTYRASYEDLHKVKRDGEKMSQDEGPDLPLLCRVGVSRTHVFLLSKMKVEILK